MVTGEQATPDRSGYRVRIARLGQEPDDDMKSFTSTERLMMVWDLTVTAWAFMKGRAVEPGFRRDVVRVVRCGR
ncbi:MAG: hypothetical protein ACREMK_04300 [Gemmatimonadota bacterium]